MTENLANGLVKQVHVGGHELGELSQGLSNRLRGGTPHNRLEMTDGSSIGIPQNYTEYESITFSLSTSKMH